ncbi:MAG: metallophosphoesterase [Candidatus Bipolaricaulota bacterium]|nr:MAG: metallophosphoesterase [Candidatus Bipolaricaulota bacterium]
MKIGILSDTHDRLPLLERVVERFAGAGVELVLHAGDFVSPFTAIPLAQLEVPFVGVFGNNDGDRLYLTKRFEAIGPIHLGYHTFESDGLRAVLMHEPKSIDALAASGHYDLVVYGHTHEIDLREGDCTVINPGEGCGYLSGRATAVIFDTETRRPELIDL